MLASIAQIVPCTEAEGPGRRFAVWFQGCPLRCPGCCNPEMLPFQGGTSIDVADLCRQLSAAAAQNSVDGISLLGGEPFAHAAAAAELAQHAHALDLGVMVYTGYVLEDLRRSDDPAVARLLAQVDLLVDGPYVRELPDTTRRWIGSTNQRIHFLTDRYVPNDPCWHEPNTLEIRWRDGELSVNGFPSPSARLLWKRPALKGSGP